MKKVLKNGRKPLAIKRSMSGIGKKLSEGADRVADIILDKSIEERPEKTKKITKETVTMLKGVTRQFKENIGEVKPREFLCDAAYGMGRITSMTKKTINKLADYFLE